MRYPKFSGKPKRPRVYLRRIVGDSMLPTLRHGQLVLFATWLKPKAGDIVMVRHGGREKIKRIADMDDSSVYLLGDNPAASTDSRQFGRLPLEQVVAKLLWPREYGSKPLPSYSVQ